MTDQLQAAAKAGDIKAIEALMNKAFEPKGLTVRVTNSGRLLKVVIRGKTAPDRALLPTIKAGLANISPQGFDQFVVTARAIGKSNAWSYQGDFTKDEKPSPKAKAASTPPPPQPKPLPKADSVPPKPEVNTATSDAVTGQEQSKAWYQRNWLIIGFLVLSPVIGIPLAWVGKWPKVNKIGASVASGLWFLLILISTSLSEPQTTTAQESAQSPTPELVVAPENTTPDPTTDRTFADAVNAAMAASEAAQAASTPDEWRNVATLWARASALMTAVPETNENYQTAQQKATEYQANLDYANRNSGSVSGNQQNQQTPTISNAYSKAQTSLLAIQAYLLSKDPERDIFTGASLDPDNDFNLVIGVEPLWHLADRNTQEFFLLEMGRAWQDVRSPDEPNKAMLFVIDVRDAQLIGRYSFGKVHLE